MIKYLLLMIPFVSRLKKDSDELYLLKRQIDELYVWCMYDFPEVGSTAKWLKNFQDHPPVSGAHGSIDCFRRALRDGKCTRNFAMKKPKAVNKL